MTVTAVSQILLPPRELSCNVAHNVTFSFCSEPWSVQTGCFEHTISPKVYFEKDEQGKGSQGVLQMRNRPWNKLEGTGFPESPRKFYAMTGKACKLKGRASTCKGRDWTPPSFSGRHLFTMRFVKFFTDIISFNP